MIKENIYAVSENFLPNPVCEDIIKRASELSIEEGVAGDKVNKTVRNSRVTWLSDPWIFDWITPAVHELNQQLNWNFDISIPENIQFTRYTEGQFYNWHIDNKFSNSTNYDRKISVVIPLKDDSEYEGGDLEFYDSSVSPQSTQDRVVKKEEFRKKGNLIVFPSYLWHRVTKVTKGERLSIVIWFNGVKFR
tara:strand:- start:2697 stop:3269 length:573 start_codon:yes stop_codon:yes gene_type:complete